MTYVMFTEILSRNACNANITSPAFKHDETFTLNLAQKIC